MAADEVSLPRSRPSKSISIGGRSKVKSFVNQFEEKLRVDCNAPAQFQQSYATAESFYSNIPHVMPDGHSSEKHSVARGTTWERG